jgi:hypothetical protein
MRTTRKLRIVASAITRLKYSGFHLWDRLKEKLNKYPHFLKVLKAYFRHEISAIPKQ